MWSLKGLKGYWANTTRIITSLGAPEWCPIWLVVSMSMKNMIVFGNHPAVWLKIKTFEHVNVTCQYDTIMTMCECHRQASEVMKMNWTLNSNVAMVLYGACVCVPDSEISKKCPSMSILEGLCMSKKKIVINDNSPSYTVHEINTSVVSVVTVITTQILGMQIDTKNGPRIMVVAVRTQILQDEGATSRDKARKTKEELLSYSKFAGLAMAQTMVKPSLKTPVFKKSHQKWRNGCKMRCE